MQVVIAFHCNFRSQGICPNGYYSEWIPSVTALTDELETVPHQVCFTGCSSICSSFHLSLKPILLSLWSDCTTQTVSHCFSSAAAGLFSSSYLNHNFSTTLPLCSLTAVSFLVVFSWPSLSIVIVCEWACNSQSQGTLCFRASGSALMTHAVALCRSACLWQHERQLGRRWLT